MFTKAAYIEKRRAALRALDQEIARLTDFAGRASDDEAGMYYEAIDGLLVSRDHAAKKLRELRAASDKSWEWEDATTGVEEAWKELRNAVLIAIAATYGEAERRMPQHQPGHCQLRAARVGRISPRGAMY